MKKIDVRHTIKKQGLFQYEVADKAGISEMTLIRWLRTALTPKQQDKIETAIQDLVNERKTKTNCKYCRGEDFLPHDGSSCIYIKHSEMLLENDNLGKTNETITYIYFCPMCGIELSANIEEFKIKLEDRYYE